MSKGARAFVATMDAQAKERSTVSALRSEVDGLKKVIAALREYTDLGEVIAEAEERSRAEAEEVKRRQEAEAKSQRAQALKRQMDQIQAQLAELAADGLSPESVAASLSPKATE